MFSRNFRVNLLRLDVHGLTVPKHVLIREECGYQSVNVYYYYYNQSVNVYYYYYIPTYAQVSTVSLY